MLVLAQSLAEHWMIFTPDFENPEFNGQVQLAEFASYSTEGKRVKPALEEAAALSFAVLIRNHPDRGWEVQSHSSEHKARMQGAVERALRLVGSPVAA